MKKSPAATISIIILTLLATAYVVFMWFKLFNSPEFAALDTAVARAFVAILLGINLIFLVTMWIPAFREVTWLVLYLFKRKELHLFYEEMNNKPLNTDSKVLVCYCYYNEFDERALRKSIKQNYHNYEFVLLDDSTISEIRAKVDKTAAELRAKGHKISVFRRENRKGFKGGALNNYLNSRDDYDYFAVADSDEILCYDFITQMLKYFAENEKAGGVQACHEPRKAENLFDAQTRLTLRAANHCASPIKNKYGQVTLGGHGMLLSREAFLSAGGFPEIVSEDTGLTTRLITAGYDVVYAGNVICEEACPVNYLAHKKRETRWVQGDIELSKKKLLKSVYKSKNVSFVSKIDLFITYIIARVISFLGAIVILASVVAMWAIGFTSLEYGIGLVILGALAFVISLIQMIIFNIGRESFWRIICASITVMVVMSSLLASYVGNVMRCLLGYKPTFVVTPKKGQKFTFWDGIKYNWGTLLFMSILLAITWAICKNPAPALVMFLYALASVFVTIMSNFHTREQRRAIKQAGKK